MSKKYKKSHTISYLDKKKILKQERQQLVVGNFGIKILQPLNIYAVQLNQYKALITKVLKGANKIFDLKNKGCFYREATLFKALKIKTQMYPFNSETQKAQGSRMGKGKGAVIDHYYPMKAGLVIFELINFDANLAKQCFILLRSKISSKISLIVLSY